MIPKVKRVQGSRLRSGATGARIWAVLVFGACSVAGDLVLDGHPARAAQACAQPCYALAIARDADPAILAATNAEWQRALDLRAGRDPRLLAAALEDPAEVVRIMAAQWLGFVGPPGEVAVPALVRAVANDTSERVRIHSASALGRYPKRGAEVIPVLTAQLGDGSAQVRQAMEATLRRFGAEGSAALAAARWNVPSAVRAGEVVRTSACRSVQPRLTLAECRDRIRSVDASAQLEGLSAAWYLGNAGEVLVPDVAARIPTWVACGVMGRERVRAALHLLTRLGSRAEAAAPHVEPLLESSLTSIRELAFQAYVAIRRAEALPVIRQWMGEERPAGDRARALWFVHTYVSAREAMPLLERYIRAKDLHLRAAAIQAAARCGGEAAPLVTALSAGIDDPITGNACVHALRQIGPAARDAVPRLVQELESEIERFQERGRNKARSQPARPADVAQAIIGIDADAVIGSLVRMLKSDDSMLIRMALNMLNNVPSLGGEARAAVEAHAMCTDLQLRRSALITLSRHDALDFEILSDALTRSFEPPQLEHEIRLLAGLACATSVRSVLVAGSTSTDEALRRRCVLALSCAPRQGSEDLSEILAPALDRFARQVPPRERALYLRALNRVDPPTPDGTRTVASVVPSRPPAAKAPAGVVPPASAPRTP